MRFRELPCLQRIKIGAFDGLYCQIDVEVWPVQVMGMRPFHLENSSHRCFPEPGKLLEREEELPIVQEEPEAVLRDIRDLNVGNHAAFLVSPGQV